ncbi:DUF262 domain-containing protein [Brevibacillus sp. NPDC058079]|uniref:DUF262 domain-containing protein n=1 Tax=Brevibacillus sp. NPDC058079 TaxID=3346330 RepID=UPI0036EFAB7A
MKQWLEESPKRFVRETSNFDVATLLIQHENNPYNLTPSYQRGLVWSVKQKEELICSIVEWLPINAIFLNERSEDEPIEVVDGKQRLTTIFDFCNDRFTWRGYLFSELPDKYKAIIKSFKIAIYLTRYKTEEECEKLFKRINFTGTPHERRETM